MAKNPNVIINELVDDDPYSQLKEEKLHNQLSDLYFQMRPYDEERNKEIVRKINAGDKSDTPYPKEYTELSNKHSELKKQLDALRGGRADRLLNQYGRKRYENFKPFPNSIPLDPNNPGGSPEITGADRIYALYDYAMRNGLDFKSMLLDDRRYFPDRTPSTYEFENDKFDLGKALSGDHYRKKDGKWEHVSTGTNYGSDLEDLLGKGNFK